MDIHPIGNPFFSYHRWYLFMVYGLWIQHVVVCQPWTSCINGLDYISIPSGYLLHSHGIDGLFIDGLPFFKMMIFHGHVK